MNATVPAGPTGPARADAPAPAAPATASPAPGTPAAGPAADGDPAGAAGGTPAGAWPDDVVLTPDGQPAVVLVRTSRGWTPLVPAGPPGGLPLVEAMALGDLVAEASGARPEPDRHARRAARGAPAEAAEVAAPDQRDVELAALRRTVSQLEHALAARVSIERAIGVLAERHGTDPRAAFDELRRRAREQGRPAQDLAREVLDGLAPRAAGVDRCTTSEPAAGSPSPAEPVAGPHAAQRPSGSRRVTRRRQPGSPGTGAEAHS